MEHPITPPDDLVKQWLNDATGDRLQLIAYIATQAARWGDEQRLEACFAWLKAHQFNVVACELRAAMRPKQPSLAEQAEQELFAMRKCANRAGYQAGDLVIDRALKRLAELEALSDD